MSKVSSEPHNIFKYNVLVQDVIKSRGGISWSIPFAQLDAYSNNGLTLCTLNNDVNEQGTQNNDGPASSISKKQGLQRNAAPDSAALLDMDSTLKPEGRRSPLPGVTESDVDGYPNTLGLGKAEATPPNCT